MFETMEKPVLSNGPKNVWNREIHLQFPDEEARFPSEMTLRVESRAVFGVGIMPASSVWPVAVLWMDESW